MEICIACFNALILEILSLWVSLVDCMSMVSFINSVSIVITVNSVNMVSFINSVSIVITVNSVSMAITSL